MVDSAETCKGSKLSMQIAIKDRTKYMEISFFRVQRFKGSRFKGESPEFYH
jgi:hypothetical protein